MRRAYGGRMRHAITSRTLLAAIEAKRRAEAAARWTESLSAATAVIPIVEAPADPR